MIRASGRTVRCSSRTSAPARRCLAVGIVSTLVAMRAAAQDGTRVDTTVALPRTATVEVGLASGTIVVRGVDREVAHVRASSASGTVRVLATEGLLRVSVQSSGLRRRTGEENRFELEVPTGVRVIAMSTSADIDVRDTRGEVEARTTSGQLTIVGARRRVTAGSTSGDISLRDVDGTVRVGTLSGELQLDEVSGSLEASAVSGSVVAHGGRLAEVRIDVVSGDIEFAAAIDRDGRGELRAHSGDIVLRIDGRTPMLLAVETFSGEITSRIPAVMQPSDETSRRTRRMELAIGGATGAPGPRVVLTTFSGDILIGRGGAP